ncbi:MAG: hypothetical protein HND52_03690 [Ignavibacteriae bacterium]|nr:hypothetical protein [Ignavibacteriota bacterium]NOG97058.1 hypothetical protein [Ignavibacteriota bacterium]
MDLNWIKEIHFECYLDEEELENFYVYGLDRIVYLLTKLHNTIPRVANGVIENLKEIYVVENYSTKRKSEIANQLGIRTKDVKAILIKHGIMKELVE